MVDVSTSIHDTQEIKPAIRPERVAWIIMLASFAIFCVFCAVTTVGLQFFFFQSSVSLNTVFQPGRGTPGVRDGNSAERTVRSIQQLDRGAFVRTDMTDSTSQATILFSDTNDDSDLISLVTLKGDTSLLLNEASRPRFSWSVPNYDIELMDVSGEIEVFVKEDLPHSLRMNIWTLTGTRIILQESGLYVIIATETQTRVINRSGGDIIILPQNSDIGRLLSVGNQASLSLDSPELVISPNLVNLITNSDLRVLATDETSVNQETTLQQPPTGWGCSHVSDEIDAPAGYYSSSITPDGRRAFHIRRDDGATSHGETSCEKFIGADGGGVVADYNYLEIRSTLYIHYQSVTACGEQGSECPLMLQVNYIGEDGVARTWRHGIYAEPSNIYPLRCDTCIDNHIRIYRGAWYTYESGNLFAILGLADRPEARPREITSVRLYASGHQYDVYVSQVSLLAGNVDLVESLDSNSQ